MVPWWVWFICWLLCVPFVIAAVAEYGEDGEDPDWYKGPAERHEDESDGRELMYRERR